MIGILIADRSKKTAVKIMATVLQTCGNIIIGGGIVTAVKVLQYYNIAIGAVLLYSWC